MFETAELGRKVPKNIFAEEEPKLHTALLEAQRRLREANFPVIIIVSGVEGAGKGNVVNRLNKWLDTRGMQTHAFWDLTDEETQRPRYWRFWQRLPPAGTIGILFGSWYTQPIIDRVYDNIDEAAYERELRRIEEFERLLADGGALIIKFWFHLSKEEQKKQLKIDAKSGRISSPLLKKFSKKYGSFAAVSERAIRMTDTGACPWYLIESTDKRYRDLSVGQTLLRAMQQRLDHGAVVMPNSEPHAAAAAPTPEAAITILDHVDLGKKLSESRYDKELKKYQNKLFRLAWKAREQKLFTVAVFEGWDAAGKGGAIRRVTGALDARLYRAISVAAPTDEEKAQHYLWRFWRHIPRVGHMTIYDRSWYGRVLVERVEGFCREHEWKRAYQEINDFEEQLTEHGVVMLKFWVHISPDEQLRRFEERQQVEWKQHKITDEDWRNREKWDAYTEAINDMVARTSTEYAPWTIVPGNDKLYARVNVVQTFCERLGAALEED